VSRSAYAAKRLLQLVPLLLGILLLVFLLLKITPGDPARVILGIRASDAQLDALREQLGLNDPLVVQYIHYVGRVLHGDLGRSIRTGQPVTAIIGERLPVTLWLLAMGSMFAVLLAIPMAMIAAMRQDRGPDHAVRGATLLGLTLPPYWVGIILIAFIALPTGAFPVSGYGTGFSGHLQAMILPSVTLAVALAPVLVRSLRARLIEIEDADYISMAYAVGISERRVIWRHAFPNGLLPLITLLAVEIGFALFGAVAIETTFSLPGLGQGMVDAVNNRDFTVVQGITLVFALLVVLVHLLADLAYTVIDPRVELR
jgi:peptide/nickel transport system permease protein